MLEVDVGVGVPASAAEDFFAVRTMFRVIAIPLCVGRDQLLPEQRSIRSSSSQCRAHIRSGSP